MGKIALTASTKTKSPFKGVITPVLTPFNDDLSVANDLYLDHCARMFRQGSTYLSPFGTTGEASSVTMKERMQLLELLVVEGVVEPGRLMPGTGLCALDETVELTRHAVDLGCAAVMSLPPFFYINATDDGLVRYFSTLIERVNRTGLRICLYNIPPLAGIGFSPRLTARLADAFPEAVVAYKDSSGDWYNTKAVLDAAPGISTFPGSEAFLLDGMDAGGAGCISATCNVNVANIRTVYDLRANGDRNAAETAATEMLAARQAIQNAGLIPALKSITALATGDRRWLKTRPPLEDADADTGRELCSRFPTFLRQGRRLHPPEEDTSKEREGVPNG